MNTHLAAWMSTGLRTDSLETCRVAVVSADKMRRQDVDNSAHILIVPQLLAGKCWQAPPDCCFNMLLLALCLPVTACGPCWIGRL